MANWIAPAPDSECDGRAHLAQLVPQVYSVVVTPLFVLPACLLVTPLSFSPSPSSSPTSSSLLITRSHIIFKIIDVYILS